MKFLSLFLFFITALLLHGCGSLGPDPEDIACTLDARPALLVNIQPGSSERTSTVTVIAQENAFADSARVDLASFQTVGLAIERAGTYLVTIEKDDVVVWQRAGIRVEQGICHVETVSLEADLEDIN